MKRVVLDKDPESISVSSIRTNGSTIIAFKTDGMVYTMIGVEDEDWNLLWAFHGEAADDQVLYQSRSFSETIREAVANGEHVVVFEKRSELYSWAMS